MNIELHIERLILDGVQVDPNRRAEVRAAVETELTRLLAFDGLRPELTTGGARRTLGAGEIRVTNATTAHQLGNHIAEAVHRGIGADRAAGLAAAQPRR